MNLTFIKDVTKNGQDGATYLCKFYNKEDVVLSISRTASSKLGYDLDRDSAEDIIKRIDILLDKQMRVFRDVETLKSIDIMSSQIVLTTNSTRQTIYI